MVSLRSKVADFEKELETLEADISFNIPRHDWEALQKASARKQDVENQLIEIMAQLEQMEAEENA
jgi:hypothetical protein